jgi:shikimate dehydrogenase
MKRYGLIGRTLTHSFSQRYFARKFEEAGLTDHVYQNFELKTITDFPAIFTHFPDVKGVNVTIPYKEEVLRYLTTVSEVVKEIGACNCIRVKGNGLIGYNTDVVGFRQSLEPRLKPWHQKALVLGTGGAAKAIQYVLKELGIGYKMVSRQKAEENITYEEVNASILEEYLLIINTTPLGMYPHVEGAPSLPYQLLTPRHFLFDSIYNPEKTTFLNKGEKMGAQICNGYEMLIGQAEESWRIWSEEQ